MANKNNQFVVAYYNNAAAAEAAADDLKNWDHANHDIKLGAVGVLHLDPKSGELKVQETGQRDTGKGALWGTAIGATLGVLTAGILLVPGMVAGAAAGSILGAFNHKSLGMTDANRDNLVEQLRHGGAALGVMCDDFEVEATMAEMTRLGGTAEVYKVPDATAADLTAAAAAQNEAADAVDAEAAASVSDTADSAAAGAVKSPAAAAGLAAAIGLDKKDSDSMSAAGVSSASALLKQGSTPVGRAALAKETGIDEAAIYTSVKKVDLMRVKGVGYKYAGLLVETGVDSVPELGSRNAVNLTAAMATTNAKTNSVDNLASEAEVSSWVAQAKTMKKMVY